MKLFNKSILCISVLIMLSSIVYGYYVVPAADMNFRDTYSIYDAIYLNATYIYLNGSLVATAAGSGDITAVNTYGPYLLGGQSSGEVNLTINETKLNTTIDARDSDTTYSHLSNFTDDLGDRGYTHFSNFTNDLDLINSSYGNSTYILQSSESNLNTNSSIYLIGNITESQISNLQSYILQSEEGNLNVNSSGYWDDIDTPADFVNVTVSGYYLMAGTRLNSSQIPDHNGHSVLSTFQHIINRGKAESISIGLIGGLGINWSTGELYDEDDNIFITTIAGSGNLTNHQVNYLKWVNGTDLTLSASDTTGTEILIATFSTYDGNINGYRNASVLNEAVSNTRRSLRIAFPTRIISGMSVSEDTDVTNALDVTMDSGQLIKDGLETKNPVTINSRTINLVRHFHTAGVWDSDTNAEINTSNYDNGTDLIAIPAGKYVKSYFMFMNGKIGWVYPTAYYNTIAQAEDSSLSPMPPGLALIPKLTTVIYQQGASDFTSATWQDIRPGISEESFDIVTDHGSLAGLSDDDHTQYILVDATRAFTANFDQGVYNFTNTNSWWLGKVNWSTIQNKFITAVDETYINMVGTNATLNETKLNATISDLDTDTNETTRINNLVNNACTAGNFIHNFSQNGTPQCDAPAGSGDITAVNTNGKYLTGGAASGDVSLLVDESELNTTILALAVSGTNFWIDGGDYLYPNSSYATNINITGNLSFYDRLIVLNDSDTYIDTPVADQLEFVVGGLSFIHLIESAGNGITFNQDSNDIDLRIESDNYLYAFFVDGASGYIRMNNLTDCDTIDTDSDGILSCGNDADTTYSAGNGISLSTTTFSVAGNTALTQDADGLSVTADEITDTELEYNTGQHLTTTGTPEFATLTTGQGQYELFAMNQDVESTDAVTFATIDTGQGANELYDMDQNVLKASTVIYNNVNITTNITTVDNIIFSGDTANHKIYDNATCIIIKSGTTTLEICE